MKTYINAEMKDLEAAAGFKGFEVLDAIAGINNSSYRSLTIKDTLTGETIKIQMSAYSDFVIAIEQHPVMIEKCVLTGELNGLQIRQVFDTAELATAKVQELSIQNPVYTKTLFEKE